MKSISIIFIALVILFSCNKESSVEDVTKTACDSLKQGLLKPNASDTLRLLSCIKISYCDSIRLGLLKFNQDSRSLDCNSIIIGSQKWMTKNLDVITYSNGDAIPQVTDKNQWSTLTTGAWCYYNNDSNNNAIYGKLYNWYAVTDSRGLAPKGWHIPSDGEWTQLSEKLGGLKVSGGKMKTVNYWKIPNIGATNSSGFLGLPAGFRSGSSGNFAFLGETTLWWSSTEYLNPNNNENTFAHSRTINFNDSTLGKVVGYKNNGVSVRCLKD